MRLRVIDQRTAEYRMSKEGILSILSKKTERSDSTLRQSSIVIRFFRVSFSIRPAVFLAGGWAEHGHL
jgi:hypothetical protein